MYILALDQGTTSSRASVIDAKGEIISSASVPLQPLFPNIGWVEQDPAEIISSQIKAAKNALASVEMDKIKAIGITNQRETTILWDKKSKKPLYNAIVWQDRRTAPFCEKLKKQNHEKMVQEKTGLLLDPYFSATKVAWILDNDPTIKEKAKQGDVAFGTVDSWLCFNLSDDKAHITDPSNASRTLLYNIRTHSWDEELLNLFDIPSSILPEVVPTSGNLTTTSHFGTKIPIASIIGDQQAALFGQGCFTKGRVNITYGTGCFVLMHTGDKPITSQHHLLSSIAWHIGDNYEYALEGSIFNAGSVIEWLIDNLNMITEPSEIDQLAESVQDSNGVIFIPALTGLGAPHWNPNAKGMIMGLTRGTEKGHIARATLEAIAFQVEEILDVMLQESGITLEKIAVAGGLCASDILLQIQADVAQTAMERTKIKELTSMGAAFLAGLAINLWQNEQEIASLRKIEKSFSAQKHLDKQYQKWKKILTCVMPSS